MSALGPGCVKTKKWLFYWAKDEQFARREFDFRVLVFEEAPRIRVRGRCANSPRSFHTAWVGIGRLTHTADCVESTGTGVQPNRNPHVSVAIPNRSQLKGFNSCSIGRYQAGV
jgi:hypothetical protein